ncbi:hypothetical protein [Cupriavidus necator]|uniref:hypothetical protein n=1 Tax=Cupriavidus necator TaxID=106590 RepID=UPI0005B39788|nr:hypothetical protein [Cupriavidus necator]
MADHKDAHYYLVLRGKAGIFSFRLGKSFRHKAIREHVTDNDFIRYDEAYFATPGYRGIDISSLPAGDYEAFISLSQGSLLTSEHAPTSGSRCKPNHPNNARSHHDCN